MVFRYILIILFLFVTFIIQAQDTFKINGLKNNLKTAKADTFAVKLYLELGDLYEYNLPESAITFYNKALKMSEHINSKIFITKSLNNIGVCYYYRGMYQQAVDNYMRSLSIYEELGNKNGIADCYNNIGNIYDIQGIYDKALEFYFESLKLDDEIGNKIGMATCYNNIGVVYWNQNNYDKALEYYMQSVKISEDIADKKGMADSYNNIGLIYFSQNEYNKANEYLLKSLKLKKELEDRNGISLAFMNIAELNIRLKKNVKAIDYAMNGLNIAKEIKALNLQKSAYFILSEANDSLKNYKNSYEFFKLYKQINDSIFNENSSKQITEMQTKYEIEKKNKENELQDLLLHKHRIYLFFMVIMSIAMMIALTLMIRSNIKTKHINHKLKMALKNIRTLSGLLPICASCKKIRGDSGYWTQVEDYISSNSDVIFSHSLCPDCTEKLYPKYKHNGKIKTENEIQSH